MWTWDVAGGRPAGLPFDHGRIGTTALSRDGGLLAVQRDGAVAFVDVKGRREAGPRIRVPGHTDFVSAMAFSPDGASLAVAGFDRRVRVFDVATRRQIGPRCPSPSADSPTPWRSAPTAGHWPSAPPTTPYGCGTWRAADRPEEP